MGFIFLHNNAEFLIFIEKNVQQNNLFPKVISLYIINKYYLFCKYCKGDKLFNLVKFHLLFQKEGNWLIIFLILLGVFWNKKGCWLDKILFIWPKRFSMTALSRGVALRDILIKNPFLVKTFCTFRD